MKAGLIDFNEDWKFTLKGQAASAYPEYDDSDWRSLSLPHDWSIQEGYDHEKGEAATGFLLGGIGWYRKRFKLNQVDSQKVFLIFDGVYNRSEVWLNGKKLGDHPYGYSPFYFDITESLKLAGEENILAVKVDHSRHVDSRWYTGSGIYRKVELLVTGGVYLPVWSPWVYSSSVSHQEAEICYQFTLKNDFIDSIEAENRISIVDSEGKTVKKIKNTQILKGGEDKDLSLRIFIENPQLWNIEDPSLYTLVHQILVVDQILEVRHSRFGIRKTRFDVNKGFFLNGKNLKIKGVCLHHCAGLAGAAVPRDVWLRRLLKLKEMGCNAIRSAHNPPSSEFLNLCDELGFLVQDEFYDEWDNPKDKRLNMKEKHDDYFSHGHAEYFQTWAKKDLQDIIRCQRNHPSVFQWSIGNEIEWTYPRNVEATGFFGADADGNYFWNVPPHSPEEILQELKSLPQEQYDIGRTAEKLAVWTREIDPGRVVTANCILPSVSMESGFSRVLDLVGFSYRRLMYDYCRKHYPDKICMGSENLGQWHEWKAVLERDFISGLFVWTGCDYLGEAQAEGWPHRSLGTGFLDLAGFEKPSYHMFKSLWNKEPHIYLVTQTEEDSLYRNTTKGPIEKTPGAWKKRLWLWQKVNHHWNYSCGIPVIAEGYSNCPEAELFHNGKSLGKKKLSDFPDHIYTWGLLFEPGELRLVGYHGSRQVESIIKTSDSPSGILLKADRQEILANGQDCVHIVAQLVDKSGIPVLTQNQMIHFSIDGEVSFIGLGTGACDDIQSHKSDTIETRKGRVLLVLQSQKKSGLVKITAENKTIKSNTIKIEIT